MSNNKMTQEQRIYHSKRTKKQNDSLHLYFENLAQHLNNEGYDVRIVFQVLAEKGIDVFWSKTIVKELWRMIQKAELGKVSTTELDSTGEITKIHDILNKFLSENFYINEPFPSIETLMEKHERQN